MQIFFPHEKIRETQGELIEQIKQSLRDKTNLIAHAPTGLGKTAAVLSVTLAFAIENKKTIFFITPKHTQHKIAIETLQLIKNKYNLDFTVVDLIGKRWMCAQIGASELTTGEFYDYCKDLIKDKECDYYNNIKNKDKLSLETENTLNFLNSKILHVEELKDYSKKRKLCPFEVACLVAKKASVIIADYHHILNPSIRESLLEKTKKDLKDCIIIIDEAHNLPSKCRELLSTNLSTITIDIAAREAEKVEYKGIAEIIKEIKTKIESLAKRKIRETKESLITKEELLKEIKKVINIEQITDDLLSIGKEIKKTKKRSAAISLANFLASWKGQDESFTRIIKITKTSRGNEHTLISYNCLDSSLITKQLGDSCYNLIAMSGTLTPTNMYKDLLGFEALTIELKNPFPTKNRLDIIIPETTTKYTARTIEMFEKISNYCSQITNEIPGNSAVFFPSYDLRDKVYNYMQSKCNKTMFLEVQNMNKQEKIELLEKFKAYKPTGAVLLGASGGNFGEGIDIEENILKCVIVVGIPLEKPDLETQELINYYENKFKRGWDYGYIMPALIKCLQNAGRCIRSETDKGVIIFLDQRYIWDNYFKCFPKDANLIISKTPLSKIKEFFNNNLFKPK